MQDVSLHSPVPRSSGAARRAGDMGQYTYDNDNDDDGEAYAPHRIWPTMPRYAARVLSPREYPQAVAPHQQEVSRKPMYLVCALGLVVFACAAASFVIVALYMDSALGQVRHASYRIAAVVQAVSDNSARLARLASLLDAWVGNATALDVWLGNATLAGASQATRWY